MSGNCEAMSLKEEDVRKILACGAHLGSDACDFQMEQYIYKRKPDGIYIFNMRHIWEKMLLAARAIAAIENPADVFVISSRTYGQRAILKYASATGATPIAGRFTPGTFTNYIQKNFREPRLVIVTDPRADHQAVTEASYVNIPIIALCNTDTPVRYVDVAVPINNKSLHSIGLAWWFLAREVLRLRGTISREVPWEIMVDLYFYRDPEEVEKEEQAAAEKEYNQGMVTDGPQQDWAADVAPEANVNDWAAESDPAVAAATATAGAAAVVAATGAPKPGIEDWAAQSSGADDWAAQSAAAGAGTTDQWGGNAPDHWA